jgi:hypothetical protein
LSKYANAAVGAASPLIGSESEMGIAPGSAA